MTIATTETNTTLAEIVATNPAAARILDGFGLDYCCHGNRSLGDACATAGVDPSVVATKLGDLDAEDTSAWSTLAAPELAAHIVATHHRYLWDELPLLDALAAKVLAVHSERHPELVDVRNLVAAVRADLEPHLLREERILFPAIEAAAHGRRELSFGPVANPIRRMHLEHERVGELLARLREVTGAYAPPADACASYRSLYERLEELALDTHLHILKENQVLFPAALRLVEA